MEPVRVLVTGAAGYLGRVVVQELLAAGHEVVALVRRAPPDFSPAVELWQGDLLDPGSLRAAAREVTAVCHLAALVQVREAMRDPLRYYRVNVGGTINLLEALADVAGAGTARVVLASTGAVYGGSPARPISETTAPEPGNPYAATKLAAEDVLRWQSATGAITATVLRIFNVAGAAGGTADPDRTRIVNRAIAVASGQADRLTINGDGRAVRDFVHVRDVARAFTLAVTVPSAGASGHALYNVAATPASVLEVVEAVRRITGRPVPVEHLPGHPGEPAALIADTARIRAELGWLPGSSTLETMLTDAWAAAPR
jgi:UDP-glucose 4-epimerase